MKTSIKSDAQHIEDEEERQEFFEHAVYEVHEFQVLLPQMQRQANLMMIMSFFEIELNKLCDRIRKEQSQTIRVTDLANQGIERARKYLTKIAGVTTPWDTPHWAEVKRAVEIRNAIVHNDGRIQSDETKRYIGESPHLVMNPNPFDDKVELEKTYSAHVLEEIRSIYHLVLKEVRAAQDSWDG